MPDKRTASTDAAGNPGANRFPKRVTPGSSPPGASPTVVEQYTPLEQQFRALKAQYPDTILAIEVGYLYRFFGTDSQVAAAVLSITSNPGPHLRTSSVPAARVMVHIKRLVWAGYKVGVVRQKETAALKSIGPDKYTPFKRQLDELYTLGTWIGPSSDLSLYELDTTGPPYLLCLVERPLARSAAGQGQVEIGLLLLQTATGDLVYDCFTDSPTRNQLEARLNVYTVAEIIMPKETTAPTRRCLVHHAQQAGALNQPTRIEYVSPRCMHPHSTLAQRIAQPYQHDGPKLSLAFWLALPSVVRHAAELLWAYLQPFGLQRLLYHTANYSPLHTKAYMRLNATALYQLEILANKSTRMAHGSLFWVMDHTQTPFGRRLLRQWAAYPLIDPRALEQRRAAVDELLTHPSEVINDIKQLLAPTPDLQRLLTRLLVKKITPPELVNFLEHMRRLCSRLEQLQHRAGFTSKLLQLKPEQSAPIWDLLNDFDQTCDVTALANDQLSGIWKSSQDFPLIADLKQQLSTLHSQLAAYLLEQRARFPAQALHYVDVNGIPYQLEVASCHDSLVPPEWIRVSATKHHSRFHSPWLIAKLLKKQQVEDQLAEVAQQAFMVYVEHLGDTYHSVKAFLSVIAQLDCLYSFAVLARQGGYVKPTMTYDTTAINIVDAAHPILRAVMETEDYIANDVDLAVSNFTWRSRNFVD
ncbi:Mismatch repair protein msh3 [Dimargaris xerosporica]|nr:Mismatch repair protein msh3 [Dimargaris xerosporica]